MKVDVTCPDVLACSIYEKNLVCIISTVSDNFKWNPTKKKFYSKIEKKTVNITFHSFNAMHM